MGRDKWPFLKTRYKTKRKQWSRPKGWTPNRKDKRRPNWVPYKRVPVNPPPPVLGSPDPKIEVKCEDLQPDSSYLGELHPDFSEIGKEEVTETTELLQESSSLQKCILCNSPTSERGISSGGDGDDDFLVMFLLLKILDIPKEQLENQLRQNGPPKSWITSCEPCRKIILEAFHVQKQINQLETSLRRHQTQIKSKMITSWTPNETFDSSPLSISTCSRYFVNNQSWPDIPVAFVTVQAVYSPPSPVLEPESPPSPVHEPESPPGPSRTPRPSPLPISIMNTSSPYFLCKLCPALKSLPLGAYLQHILYHKRRPFKCTVCGHFLTGDASELSHLQTSSKNAAHACSESTLCPVPFETHIIWKCTRCPATFPQESSRDNHEISSHSPPQSLQTEYQPYNCGVCLKPYKSEAEWSLHRAIEHPDESFPGFRQQIPSGAECDLCGEPFHRRIDLLDHMETDHGRQPEQAIPCPTCFTRFRDFKMLKDHFRKHKWRTRRVCDQCGYSCVVFESFLEHCFVNHGVRHAENESVVKKCPEEGCPFETFVLSKLKVHLVNEHGMERKFKCDTCGKAFTKPDKLKRHQLTHSKEKPFQCEICGSSFAVQNYLYIHKRLTHQNRPFASTNKKTARKRKKKEVPPEKPVEETPVEKKLKESPKKQVVAETPVEKEEKKTPVKTAAEETPLKQEVEEAPGEEATHSGASSGGWSMSNLMQL